MIDLTKKPFEKFTTHAKNTMLRAGILARAKKSGTTVTAHHLLEALLSEKGSLGYNILKLNNYTMQRTKMASVRQKNKTTPIALDQTAKNIIKKAVATAALYEHTYVGTEHILFGVMTDSDILKEHKRRQKILNQIKHIFTSSAHVQHFKSASKNTALNGAFLSPRPSKNNKTHNTHTQAFEKHPALSFFCEDITRTASEHPTPFFGRTQELDRLINTLLRRTKSNPLLIGEAGVGKTAIVHGLANKIAARDVPTELLNKRIFSLNVGLLVSGTVFRGEFEARLEDIIDEAQDENIILFIDELHTIMGAGSVSGTLDLANMLKPALAGGALRVIAATTIDEYKKTIEKDAALARRFQPIHIPEESAERVLLMLEHLKHAYEKHHRITISAEALGAAVQHAERYLPHRRFPDKALDLLDEASARLRTTKTTSPAEQELLELQTILTGLEREKNSAIERGDYTFATSIKEKQSLFSRTLEDLIARVKATSVLPTLTASDIEQTVASLLGTAPFEQHETLANIEHILRERIVGQDAAVSAIAGVLMRGKAGLLSRNRPLASFLFLGPSGVGKTHTAKELARAVFGERKDYGAHITPFIRIDMSEFAEPHTVSRLLGAPPGYVGFEEGGTLTEKVKRNPYALVLFDEIEKAHPQIFNIFLQMLDEGMLTNSFGESISFKNTVIIFTSNIGTEEFNKQALGFKDTHDASSYHTYDAVKKNVLERLKETIRPELLNRIDHVLTFMPLSREAMSRLIEEKLASLKEKLAREHDLIFSWDTQALDAILELSQSTNEGARLIQRVIAERVERPLAERIVQKTVQENKKITLAGKNLVLR